MSIVVLILILSAQAGFPVAPAQAATITVTSKLDTADPGRCRLRDAITAANTNTATGDCPAGTAGLDTINFSLGITCNLTPCTILLTSALPTVTQDLTINGNNTIISGANSFRVFDLGAVTVNMSNLTIANGNVPGNGGGINMSDDSSTAGTTLSLNHVFFSNNHSNIGGAIFAPRGTLTVASSNFSGNGAGSSGGAILGNATLVVIDSTFSSNTAVGVGGAMYLLSIAIISGSTFSSNSASSGGAIFIFQNVGSATLTNVTISGNSAKNNGGGMLANVGTTILNNVTITVNTADSDNDGVGDGGGIFREVATVQVQNSIIAGNFDKGPGFISSDCSGTFTSNGYNLIGRDVGCGGFVNGVNGDKVGSVIGIIDPLLGPLADNGGTTQTHALLPGSPALDAANPLPPGSGGFACTGFDQRGIIRPQGSACDMGAYEDDSPATPTPTGTSTPPSVTATATPTPTSTGIPSGEFHEFLPFIVR
jgi:predicted outer membrane repeat protein